ncbi:magnesium transporter CorA family protein [Lactobacillus sp. LC28-10]|uniref:Magnesium transporter CorA family protein n=1 Tax=Secundilactobacillus angelensis TaxID=2722706 RepID=A0ABX1KWP8_9LACO|nr:magnesium transporter CorA family protein [Secundilactobacillus angelensis]MCH5461275.1 magnesium transporter CorA family protein [Secundilactobacillus angelensis]NLR17529.1 magnesium transporter CorA family protein [Secundilactobacillus angelensis]
MIKPTKHLTGFDWVETTALTEAEQQTLMAEYGITDDIITYVTDKDETANYVYDPANNQQLMIVLVPYQLKNTATPRYITRPVGFLIHQGVLFTFNESRLNFVDQAFQKSANDTDIETTSAFILESMFDLVDSYIPIVKFVTKQRNQLDKMLNKDAKNSNLMALSYLGQTLTFFNSGVESNNDLFTRIPRTYFGVNNSSVENDLLEDVSIESDQVQHMIENEEQVVNRITDTFDSIINNNLNDTMKFLTIWSLTMAVPTIVTGFFGMNVSLPFEHFNLAWIMVIALSTGLIAWLLLIFKMHHRL